ncbi:ABC transporter ATP-binding protein [Rhizobium sp. KVB221]|uniref:ABC transporter ATP-binding protein n=1 Tax=Rhizobium setariae TaxID=2801340 RepID=A0A936YPD3_9HYPH|nr:ABC transporter ATP-binding protein [Rhizobium setariae]MBL0374230.1 ABC transporter ATP-binding protein [Rhizobium setariae]
MDSSTMIKVGAPPAVEVRNLRIDMPGGGDIVDDVSFTIRAGEVLGLVGESGSGKTTVGMALLGFARGGATIVGGTVHVAGDTSANMLALTPAQKRQLRGKTVAHIPQDPASALNPSLTIGLQLREVIEAHEPDTSAQEIDRRIASVLIDVGLPSDPSFLGRYPHQLSGGQQQRIGIAMAVILAPKLIVLDEPTTGLDVTTQNKILDIVKRLCREHGIGALHVTHDLSVIAHIADHVMVMYSGRVVELGRVETVLKEPLHPYTQALLGAVPELHYRTRLRTIPGRASRPSQRPKGCFFHPRCPVATSECAADPIEIVQQTPEHRVRCIKCGITATAEPERLPDPEHTVDDLAAAQAVIEVSDMRVAFGTYKILDGVEFKVKRGECLAVVGESGSGKSTLSRALIGLVPQQKGTVLLNGQELAPRARDRDRQQLQTMQYIFQSPHNSLNPRQTVENIVGLVYDIFNRTSRSVRREKIAEMLDQVGLSPDAMFAFPDQLSGGERQRVAIARALMANPEVLICDEITSALDVSVQAAIVNLLKDLQQNRGLTMVFVTHNLALVRNLADRVLVLNQGKVVEMNGVAAVIDSPSHPYTKQLLANALVGDLDTRVEGPGEIECLRA